MSRKQSIERKLSGALEPSLLQVADESHKHSVPAGAESHFNVVVVSDAFTGEARVQRHRRIHELLSEELAAGLHALTLTLLTSDEYAKRGGGIRSPACAGGSKTG